jgi:putative transposase
VSVRFFQKHIRLREFDYSTSNSYFITVCTKDKECSLGEIRNKIMGLSEIGNKALIFLQQIPILRPYTKLHEHIIMPNHLHCILEIRNQIDASKKYNHFGQPVAGSISVIINQYKGIVKKWCNQNGFSKFQWQPRFYDHVIRNAEDYFQIQHYIQNNPSSWTKDRFKP